MTNNWKDHGWWIMAEEAKMPMLWITSHDVVEGRHWCTTYYHIDVHRYIYEIKYFVVVPYRNQRVQYRVYDFVAHRWNGSTLAM